MELSPKIFVSRADLIDLDPAQVDFKDFNDTLIRAVLKATEITILGGFYSARWLTQLFGHVEDHLRRNCRVRLAVGCDDALSLPEVWREMRELQSALRRLGFPDPQVAVVAGSPTHFHTKLFYIKRRGGRIWFVGSANPGSKRHELMACIKGSHDALANYVEAVFAAAQPITNARPKRKPPATLREFFLDGVLCHKPPPQQLFTFDTYHFSPEERRCLDAVLAEGLDVVHARLRTQGFVFLLRSALNLPETEDDERWIEDDDEAKGGLQIRPLNGDTTFGFWMPRAYADQVEERVARRVAENEQRLGQIGLLLAQDKGAAATAAFQAYLSLMDRYLDQIGIKPRPVRARENAFQKFLTSRTRMLTDPLAIARHARVMTFAPMIDLWSKPHAAEEFEISFFEDIAYRVGTHQTRIPRVARSIVESLDPDEDWNSPEELRDAFGRRLAARPWSKNEWR